MSKNIEVEARTFIGDGQYESIKKILDDGFKLEKILQEVTVYFSGEKDLRLRKNETEAYLILKEGKIHDNFRKEFEIRLAREDFDNMKELLESLGYVVEIEWHRKRLAYKGDGMEILLDDTEGYGKILELEKLAEEGKEKETHDELLREMERFGIAEITPREEFDKRYGYYKQHWRNLIR
jgi:predicted adenylyl cyclase CyaB